jgi:opacity protein-like surface antigen
LSFFYNVRSRFFACTSIDFDLGVELKRLSLPLPKDCGAFLFLPPIIRRSSRTRQPGVSGRGGHLNFQEESMKTKCLLSAGILLAACSASVSAQAVKSDSGVYIGIEGGMATYRVSTNDTYLRDWSESKNAGALRALIGYRFNPNFSLEMSYLSLGDYTLSSPKVNGYREKLSANTDAFDLSVIYKFTQFVPGFYLKAGAMNSTVSLQYKEETPDGAGRGVSASRSGYGYSLGLGYEFDLTPHLSANAGFTRLQRLGGAWQQAASVNANLYSAGVKYRF